MGRKRTAGRVSSNKKLAGDFPLGEVIGKEERNCVICGAPVSPERGGSEQLTTLLRQVLEGHPPPGGGNLNENCWACEQCSPQVHRVLRGDRELRATEEEVRRLQRQLLLQMQYMCQRMTALCRDLKALGEVMGLSNGDDGIRTAINSVVKELGRSCERTERKVGVQPTGERSNARIVVKEESEVPCSPVFLEPLECAKEFEVEDDLAPRPPATRYQEPCLDLDDDPKSEGSAEDMDEGWKPKPRKIAKTAHNPVKTSLWNNRQLKPEDPHRSVDISEWSSAKKKLFQVARHNLRNQGKSDPRLQKCLTFDPESDSFSVGGIAILVHDSSLQCSECHFTVSLSPEAKGVERRMQQHIQAKHLPPLHKTSLSPKPPSKRTPSHSHEGRHLCSTCGKVVSTAHSLREHRWRKHMTPEEIAEALATGQKDPRYNLADPEQPRVCDTCGKIYLSKRGLDLHERREHQGERHTCERCGKVFKLKRNLKIHQTHDCLPEGVKPPPRLPCTVSGCKQTFKMECSRRRHFEAVHSDSKTLKPYKCEQCPKDFATKGNLTHHLETHRKDKPHRCRFGCGIAFKSRASLCQHERGWCKRRHIADHSAKFRVGIGHLCSDCGKSYASPSNLRAHRWRKHMTPEEIVEALAKGETDPRQLPDPERRFVCDTCGKTYSSKTGLKIHERGEHQAERHTCNRCGKVFKQKPKLKWHQTRDCLPPGVEPPPRLPCHESGCQQTFKTEDVRRRHFEALHTDNKILKPYKCEQCLKGFSTRQNLTHHLTTHRKDKPYECRFGCGMSFKAGPRRWKHESKCSSNTKLRNNVKVICENV